MCFKIEKDQALMMYGSVVISYYDSHLSWTPELYHNVKRVVVDADKLWLPELVLMNR